MLALTDIILNYVGHGGRRRKVRGRAEQRPRGGQDRGHAHSLGGAAVHGASRRSGKRIHLFLSFRHFYRDLLTGIWSLHYLPDSAPGHLKIW